MAVQEICRDTDVLIKQSRRVSKHDNIDDLIQDLKDTAAAQSDPECVGLAAIQIGVPKRVCVMINEKDGEKFYQAYINPVVTQRSSTAHDSTESCLSLDGQKTVKRWDAIRIMYQRTPQSKKNSIDLYGLHAVIMQHEIDHMNGVLV